MQPVGQQLQHLGGDILHARGGGQHRHIRRSRRQGRAYRGLDGDVRVIDDTILVTYYNAPNVDRLRQHYENLPEKLRSENIDPHIPWLYNFQLDFRFR